MTTEMERPDIGCCRQELADVIYVAEPSCNTLYALTAFEIPVYCCFRRPRQLAMTYLSRGLESQSWSHRIGGTRRPIRKVHCQVTFTRIPKEKLSLLYYRRL